MTPKDFMTSVAGKVAEAFREAGREPVISWEEVAGEEVEAGVEDPFLGVRISSSDVIFQLTWDFHDCLLDAYNPVWVFMLTQTGPHDRQQLPRFDIAASDAEDRILELARGQLR